MTRKTTNRIGTLLGLTVIAGLALALYIAGCTTGNIGNDLGLVEPGCRTPSACWTTGIDCPCNYVDINGDTAHGIKPDRTTLANGTVRGCRTCDPTNGADCICAMDAAATVSQCIEQQEVCVGRAPTTCDGEGARCIHAGATTSCASGAGDPPNRVATGASGAVESRCAYVDDTCCPGVIDVDGGSADGSTDASQ